MSWRAAAAANPLLAYGAVGTIGFIVDGSILTFLMTGVGWGSWQARGVSFLAAVTVTWLLNRRYVFSAGKLDARAEYSGYVAIQIVGAILNLGVFGLCLKAWPQLSAWPIVPLAAGSAVGLLFNFNVTRLLLYGRRHERSVP